MTDDQMHLVPLSHEPIRAPRADVIGECVYAARWAALMAETVDTYGHEAGVLGTILSLLVREPSQRHATVAASFIKWLGTNCGRAFLQQAKQHEPMVGGGGGYAAAWGVENARRPGINGGYRAIEAILAPADHWGTALFSGHTGLVRQPDLSLDDYEAVEQLVRWLGSYEGRQFVAACEAEIDDKVKAARDERLANFAKESGNEQLQAILETDREATA